MDAILEGVGIFEIVNFARLEGGLRVDWIRDGG